MKGSRINLKFCFDGLRFPLVKNIIEKERIFGIGQTALELVSYLGDTGESPGSSSVYSLRFSIYLSME